MMRRFLACFAIAVTVGLAACQTPKLDFEAGLKAADSGDYAGAAKIWSPLSETGDMLAQYHLAKLYAEGEGVEEDPAEAARLYRLAGEQGHAEAQFSLAELYATGEGVARDYTAATEWYRRAGDQGREAEVARPSAARRHAPEPAAAVARRRPERGLRLDRRRRSPRGDGADRALGVADVFERGHRAVPTGRGRRLLPGAVRDLRRLGRNL